MWLQFLKRAALALGLAALLISSGQSGAGAEAGNVSPQATLYNQIDGINLTGVASTRVTGTFTPFNQAADDFPVPGPEWFIISRVEVRGAIAGAAPNSVLVEFYDGGSGLPTNLLYSQTGGIAGGADGNYVLDLPTPAVIRPSGARYWISVQSQSTSVTVNWFWFTRSQAPGTGASAYKSLSLDGCQNVWALRSACETTAGTGPDNQFQLSGITFVPTAFVYLPLIRR